MMSRRFPGNMMNAAGEGIFEKDIVWRKREVEVLIEKLPTLSAKLVP